MSAFNGHYAPQETSLFDEQMSAFEPSFTDSAMHGDTNDSYAVVDDAAYRPPSADGLFQPYPHHPLESGSTSRGPSPLTTYPGAVAPFSQVYSSHLSPFSPNGAFPPIASTSSSVPPAYPTFPAGIPPATALAVQAAIHQQQRVVQQHPGFLDPRQQAELLQAHQGGVAPATITPSQVQQQQNSFSIASSTPSTSTSASPPPVASSSKSGANKSTKSSSASATSKKTNGGGAVRSKHTPSASPAPPAPSAARKHEYDPDEWKQILPGVRTLLSAKRLQTSPLATAPRLLKDLRFFSHEDRADSPWGDMSDVPPEGRAEVLHSLLKYAKDEFWRVFLEVVLDKPASSSSSSTKGKGKENGDEQQPQQMAGIKSDALDLLQSWLEGASKSVVREKSAAGPGAVTSEKDRKRKELEQATLALVLQVLAKLPVEYGHLIEFKKIPKRVKAISDKAADGAVKSAAKHLVAKWQKVQERARSNPTATLPSSAVAPKRKADPVDVPAKKAKTSATPPPPPANKKAPAAAVPAGPKAPLPSFKKVPPPAPAVPAFMQALSKIAKSNAGSTEDSAANAQDASGTTAASAAGAATSATAPKKKQKKKVHWPENDANLCKYREIEAREVSAAHAASEEIGGEQHHLMEEQEGHTLTMHLLDEEDEEWEPDLEWYDPPAVEIPDTPEFAPLHDPKQSAEVAIQDEREAATMEVDLSSMVPPPDSPSEALVDDTAAVEDDASIKTLGLHPDLAEDPAFHETVMRAQLGQPPAGVVASSETITDLLGQIAAAVTNGTPPQPGAAAHPAPVLPTQELPLATQVQAPIDPAALEQLRQFDAAQVAQIVASSPQFQSLDLSAIGVALGGGSVPPVPAYEGQPQYHFGAPVQPTPGYPHVQQPYQGYVPPAAQQQHAWVPPPVQQQDLYNGYQPPVPNAHVIPPPQTQLQQMFGQQQQQQQHSRASKHPNWRTQPCKFFHTQKGCDWGDRCRFKHGP
ncbi:hypothetical protein JCM3774_003233 [Rhodotorula dairenensis]